MYPDVHFLGGKLVIVGGADVSTKAHQHHEGSPYSPLEISPLRQFSTTTGLTLRRPPNFHKFSGGIHNERFLSEELLPPRSLQPPRVTRSRGEMLKTCSNHDLLWSKEGEGVDLSLDWKISQELSQTLPGSRIWCRGVRGRTFRVVGCLKRTGQPSPRVGEGYI